MNETKKKRWQKVMRVGSFDNLEELKKYLAEKNESKGFGDTIAKITSAVGIKPCGGCKQRQEWLNKKLPYKQNESDN
jgi:hypothetical protein